MWIMEDFNTYEYGAEQKSEGKFRTMRMLMLCGYILYAIVYFVIIYITRIFPLGALIPLTLWIIVYFTWRYTKPDYRYVIEHGDMTFSISYGKKKRGKRSVCSFKVSGAVRVKDQAQFHPLKFLYTIARDLPIYEHAKVIELMPNKAKTNHGAITYKKLIIATHFPMLNKHGLYSLKLYQHRSYVIALKDARNVNGMYVDELDTGLSFRSYGDLLLLGGGGHRTGKQGGCWRELEDFARKHYKRAEIVGKWATQDCLTLDDIPYIGQYSGSTPDVFVATGFNKWGMTNAMIAAEILCDLVKGEDTPYAAVFDPSRTVLHPQLALNVFESTVGLLTPTAPRCPHLGCALKYNQAEHTWDCPCHGSRFRENGELIDNPATDDKRI